MYVGPPVYVDSLKFKQNGLRKYPDGRVEEYKRFVKLKKDTPSEYLPLCAPENYYITDEPCKPPYY